MQISYAALGEKLCLLSSRVALATQKIYFYVNNLVYCIISYHNNIYLTTTNEFICQKTTRKGKSKEIHMFDRCSSSYFDNFNHLKKLRRVLLTINCQDDTLSIFYLFF